MQHQTENINKIEETPISGFEKFFSAYCSPEWMFLLKNYLVVKNFKKDERIITEGDAVTGVYLINEGMVKIVSYFDKTNERILRLSNKGALFGHRGLYSNYYPISAIALSDTEVTFIPIDIFTILIKTNPDFSLFVITFILEDLRKTEVQMKYMIHGEVLARISIIICMLIDALGYDPEEPLRLNYTLSRKDIANIAGTTYESVIRNLTQLENKKLIKMDGKSFIISNEAELRKLAGHMDKRNLNPKNCLSALDMLSFIVL